MLSRTRTSKDARPVGASPFADAPLAEGTCPELLRYAAGSVSTATGVVLVRPSVLSRSCARWMIIVSMRSRAPSVRPAHGARSSRDCWGWEASALWAVWGNSTTSKQPAVPRQRQNRSPAPDSKFPVETTAAVPMAHPNAAPIAARRVRRNAATTRAAMVRVTAKSSVARLGTHYARTARVATADVSTTARRAVPHTGSAVASRAALMTCAVASRMAVFSSAFQQINAATTRIVRRDRAAFSITASNLTDELLTAITETYRER